MFSETASAPGYSAKELENLVFGDTYKRMLNRVQKILANIAKRTYSFINEGKNPPGFSAKDLRDAKFRASGVTSVDLSVIDGIKSRINNYNFTG